MGSPIVLKIVGALPKWSKSLLKVFYIKSVNYVEYDR